MTAQYTPDNAVTNATCGTRKTAGNALDQTRAWPSLHRTRVKLVTSSSRLRYPPAAAACCSDRDNIHIRLVSSSNHASKAVCAHTVHQPKLAAACQYYCHTSRGPVFIAFPRQGLAAPLH
jgi:hypothetical protein